MFIGKRNQIINVVKIHGIIHNIIQFHNECCVGLTIFPKFSLNVEDIMWNIVSPT